MSTVTRAKIIRGDLALYDGDSRTVSRVDATGGTVTGLRINDYVDVLQVFGSGTARTVGTINDAIARIGSTVCTVLFAGGTWTIDSNVTIPATMSAYVVGGCVFNISSSITLTFNGPLHVEYGKDDGTGWYTGSGSVSCTRGATGWPGW